jgi:hypothetical protein
MTRYLTSIYAQKLIGRIKIKINTTPQRSLALIAPCLFLMIQGFLSIIGLRFLYWREGPWQFIPTSELHADPVSNVFFFHGQPPAFNALLYVFDNFGAYAPIVWHTVFVIGTSFQIWMISKLIWYWTNNKVISLIGPSIYALLPGTHLFSMWLFYTQPVAILLTITIWSLVSGNEKAKTWYFSLSNFGMLILFLWRSSIVWPIAILWLCTISAILIKRRKQATSKVFIISLAITLFCTSTIGILTLKNQQVFKVQTQSSWVYENFAKVILYSVSKDELKIASQGNSCFKELAIIGTFQDIRKYPTCVSESSTDTLSLPHVESLDKIVWSNGDLNYNYKGRLLLGQKWKEFAIKIIEANPKIIFRTLWPSFSDQRRGSVVQFLWPSTDYKFISEKTEKLGDFGRDWMFTFAWIPLASLILIMYSILIAIVRKSHRPRYFRSYIASLSLVAYLSFTYIFLEIGENQRYRAELDPLLISLAAIGLHQALNSFRTKVTE